MRFESFDENRFGLVSFHKIQPKNQISSSSVDGRWLKAKMKVASRHTHTRSGNRKQSLCDLICFDVDKRNVNNGFLSFQLRYYRCIGIVLTFDRILLVATLMKTAIWFELNLNFGEWPDWQPTRSIVITNWNWACGDKWHTHGFNRRPIAVLYGTRSQCVQPE